MEGLAGFTFVAVIFLIVLAIVWTLLPFAVFGTKPKLDRMIAELQKANAQLAEINALLRRGEPTAHITDFHIDRGAKGPRF